MTMTPREQQTLIRAQRELSLIRQQLKEARSTIGQLRREARQRAADARLPSLAPNVYEQRHRLAAGHMDEVRGKLKDALASVDVVEHMLGDSE